MKFNFLSSLATQLSMNDVSEVFLYFIYYMASHILYRSNMSKPTRITVNMFSQESQLFLAYLHLYRLYSGLLRAPFT